MQNVDRKKLRGVIESDSLVAIHRAHGDRGTQVFRELAGAIKTIFNHIDAEHFNGRIIAFKCLDDHERPLSEQDAVVINDFDLLTHQVFGDVVIHVLPDGRFLLWRNVNVNVSAVAGAAVVYQYKKEEEYFFAGTDHTKLEKVGQYPSLYSVPVFSSLRSALEQYSNDMVLQSSCKILQDAWADKNRLFFVNRPERTMRNSLTQFLKICLRDAEVRPEQNMDESHPVDIKVTFTFTKRLALIEIKWLGKSIRKVPRKITAQYTDKRARVGADRLADYLDWNREQAPNRITRGYLVVLDGRRQSLKISTKTITQQQGGYYRHREIHFDPKYHEVREDFDAPIRMFMEPVVKAG